MNWIVKISAIFNNPLNTWLSCFSVRVFIIGSINAFVEFFGTNSIKIRVVIQMINLINTFCLPEVIHTLFNDVGGQPQILWVTDILEKAIRLFKLLIYLFIHAQRSDKLFLNRQRNIRRVQWTKFFSLVERLSVLGWKVPLRIYFSESILFHCFFN